MDEKEANYEAVKGVIERNHAGDPKQFNDSELRAIFGAIPETINKLREEFGKPDNSINDLRLKLGNVYEDILQVIDYYMDLPEEHKQVIALWIIGTYLHDSFLAYPFLFINAMRGSGKTRLLKIISHLSYMGSGMVSTEPTDAVLYRTPKGHTLVFDEFEGIGGKDKNTFRQYLNASYKAGGVVQRAKKVKKDKEESYEIETFEPFKPIAMANIWGMEEVLGDRCITLILQKSDNPVKTKKIEDFENNYTIKAIKMVLNELKCSLCSVVMQKEIYRRWNEYIDLHYTLHTYTTLTTLTTLKDWLEEMFVLIDESEINGRNLELIYPLLIIARLLNKDIFLQSLETLKQIIEVKKEEELAESKDVTFLDFVASAYEPTFNFVAIAELTRHFKAYVNELEPTDDNWINTKWVGRALKRLDLVLDKRRIARGNEVTINIPKAKDKLKMFKKEETKENQDDTTLQ